MTTATENLEMIKDLGTTGFENVRALGELNLKTWEMFIDQQIETFGLLINTSIEQVKLITETADYAELLEGQNELNRQFGENLTEKGQQAITFSKRATEEYSSWFEDGLNKLTGKVNDVVEQAA